MESIFNFDNLDYENDGGQWPTIGKQARRDYGMPCLRQAG
jgi:hypothetical protein